MGLDRDADTNAVIREIYDTAVDQSRWPQTLDRLARHVGGCGAFVFELAGDGARREIRAPWFSSTYDPALVRQYLAMFNQVEMEDQDLFARHSRATDGIELIPDDVLAGSETELLQRANAKFLMQFGIRFRMGALLNKDQVNVDRFALQFTERHGPPRPDEVMMANTLLSHVAKALSIHRPLRALKETFETAIAGLDRLKVGICIIDSRGMIVHRNGEFMRQMADYRVFERAPDGRLVLSNAEARARLGHLIADVNNHGVFGARPRKEAIEAEIDGETFRLCVEVAPISRADAMGEAKFAGHLIYSLDTCQPFDLDTAVIASMFSLTQAESDVLDLIAKGMTNLEISRERDKSVETVNTQVKALLAKTNASNRTQLIRLATNISAGLMVNDDRAGGSGSR